MDINVLRYNQISQQNAQLASIAEKDRTFLTRFARVTSRNRQGWQVERLDGSIATNPVLHGRGPLGLGTRADMTIRDGGNSVDYRN
jgi:hypothetical protein